MPMPNLDPSRHVAVVLADPSHRLPLPDRGGRLFFAEGETVDSADPFYAHLIADGSLKLAPPATEAPATAAPKRIEADEDKVTDPAKKPASGAALKADVAS